MFLNCSHLSIIINVTSVCLFIMQDCVSKHLHLKALLCSHLSLYYLNSSKMVSGAMHKSQDLFMHTVKYSFSTKQLQPTTDLHRLPLPRGVSVLLYLLHRSKTGATEQEGSRVAFARTGAEYSHDLFWKQKTFSRFRMSRIIRFRCLRRSLWGEKELIKWQREEKKTSYTFMTPHTDSREEFRCYITSANGFIGLVWHQTTH